MKWIKHDKNFEAEIPRDLRIALWVSIGSHTPGSGYGADVYMAGKLVCSWDVATAQESKILCEKWLLSFINSLIKVKENE